MSGFDISTKRVLRAGVSATQFIVNEHRHEAPGTQHDHGHDHDHSHDHSHDHPHRSLPEIFTLIDGSALSPAGRDRAKQLFQRLAEAEAAIHQMPIEKVHLHEVGALDSIIDIVGAVFGLEWFGADRIVSSALNVGGGMVDTAHGHVSRAGAGDGEAARRRADLRRLRPEGARDADRRAHRLIVRDVLWPDSPDDDRARRLRRRRPRHPVDAERAARGGGARRGRRATRRPSASASSSARSTT